jgi:hypothetical protein
MAWRFQMDFPLEIFTAPQSPFSKVSVKVVFAIGRPCLIRRKRP